MFLNILPRGPTPPQRSYELKSNKTHCTYNFNASVTDDLVQNPLPADQQLGRQQLTRCGQPVKLQQLNALWTISIHFATQIRNLAKKRVKTQTKHSHGICTLRSPTPSITKYEYWKRHKNKQSNNWKDWRFHHTLTNLFIRISTIKRECWLQQLSKNVQPPSNIEHSLVLHTQTTILNHCLITLSKDMTERLQQKSQLQDQTCFSNSNKQHQNHNRLQKQTSRRRSKKSFLLLLF